MGDVGENRVSAEQASRINLARWRNGAAAEPESDMVAREEPLEIRVNGASVAVTMRTPGHDAELAAGFLLTEGLVRRGSDVVSISENGNVVEVTLAPSVAVDLSRLTRHVFASSSCGLCGKASIDAVHGQFPAVKPGFSVRADVLATLPEAMRRAQTVFAQTGGLHAAAVFGVDGGLVALREDVGRHNAVDKVLGRGLLDGLLPFTAHVMLVSGRASFEIVQKALAAQVPVLCAVSAPSSLAVEFARENGQALVGFLREGGMNIYAGRERIR
jgi:FdhD protein